jgi:hypothetical protein
MVRLPSPSCLSFYMRGTKTDEHEDRSEKWCACLLKVRYQKLAKMGRKQVGYRGAVIYAAMLTGLMPTSVSFVASGSWMSTSTGSMVSVRPMYFRLAAQPRSSPK